MSNHKQGPSQRFIYYFRYGVLILGMVALVFGLYWLANRQTPVAQAVTITSANVPLNNEYFDNGAGDYIVKWGADTDVIIDGAKVEINHPITVKSLTLQNGATLTHAPALAGAQIPLARDNFSVTWVGKLSVSCKGQRQNCDVNDPSKHDVRSFCFIRERAGEVSYEFTHPSGDKMFGTPVRWDIADRYYGSEPKWMELTCIDTPQTGEYQIKKIDYSHLNDRGKGSPAYFSIIVNARCTTSRSPGPCQTKRDPLTGQQVSGWTGDDPSPYLKTLADGSGLVATYYAFGATTPKSLYPNNSPLKTTRIDKFDALAQDLATILVGGEVFKGFFWGQAGPFDALARTPDKIGIRVVETFSIDGTSKIKVNGRGYAGGYIIKGDKKDEKQLLTNASPDALAPRSDGNFPAYNPRGFTVGSQKSFGLVNIPCDSPRFGGGGGYGGFGGKNGPNNGRAIPDDPQSATWIGGGGDFAACPTGGGFFQGSNDSAQGASGGGHMAIGAQRIVFESGAKILARGEKGGEVVEHGDVSAGGGAGGGACLTANEIRFNKVTGTKNFVDVSGGDTFLRRAGYGGGGGGGRVAIFTNQIFVNGQAATYTRAIGQVDQSGNATFRDASNNHAEIFAQGGDQGIAPSADQGQPGTIFFQNTQGDCKGVPPVNSGNVSKTGPTLIRNDTNRYTFSIDITNLTTSTGANITIEDTLPKPLTYKKGSAIFNGLPFNDPIETVNPSSTILVWNNIPTDTAGPLTHKLSFEVQIAPGVNGSECAQAVTNAVRLIDENNRVLGQASALPTDLQCFVINSKNEVTGNREPGSEVQFLIDYSVVMSGGTLPAWELRDVLQSGKYDLTYLSDLSKLDPKVNGSSVNATIAGNIITFPGGGNGNLPLGSSIKLTFKAKIDDTACNEPKTANNDDARFYIDNRLGQSSKRFDLKLICRIKVFGDIGTAPDAGVTITRLAITGPAVIAAGQNIKLNPNPTDVGAIEPLVRQLLNYSTPSIGVNSWLEEFNKAKDRLKKEFATNWSGSMTSGQIELKGIGGNQHGVVKMDVRTGNRWRIGVSSVTFINNNPVLAGGGTVILLNRPPGSNSIELGTIDNQTNAPIALIVDDSCPSTGGLSGPKITLTGSNITIGSKDNPVAIVAPCSIVDFGTTSKVIKLTGLIVAGEIKNANHPNVSGSIKFDQKLITNPPPGLDKWLKATVGEEAP